MARFASTFVLIRGTFNLEGVGGHHIDTPSEQPAKRFCCSQENVQGTPQVAVFTCDKG